MHISPFVFLGLEKHSNLLGLEKGKIEQFSFLNKPRSSKRCSLNKTQFLNKLRLQVLRSRDHKRSLPSIVIALSGPLSGSSDNS